MANKIINVNVEDKIGNSYQELFVVHDANINSQILETGKLFIMFSYYKSQEAYQNGKMSIPLNFNNGYLLDLTDEEKKMVSPMLIQTKVTEYLKSIYGEDNVIEI